MDNFDYLINCSSDMEQSDFLSDKEDISIEYEKDCLNCSCSDCENSLCDDGIYLRNNHFDIERHEANRNNNSTKSKQFTRLNEKVKKAYMKFRKGFNSLSKRNKRDDKVLNSENFAKLEIPEEEIISQENHISKCDTLAGLENGILDEYIEEETLKILASDLKEPKEEQISSTTRKNKKLYFPKMKPQESSENAQLEQMHPCTSASVSTYHPTSKHAFNFGDSTQKLTKNVSFDIKNGENFENWINRQLQNKSNSSEASNVDLIVNTRRQKIQDIIKRINDNKLPSELNTWTNLDLKSLDSDCKIPSQEEGTNYGDTKFKMNFQDLFDDSLEAEKESGYTAYCSIVDVEYGEDYQESEKPALQICSATFNKDNIENENNMSPNQSIKLDDSADEKFSEPENMTEEDDTAIGGIPSPIQSNEKAISPPRDDLQHQEKNISNQIGQSPNFKKSPSVRQNGRTENKRNNGSRTYSDERKTRNEENSIHKIQKSFKNPNNNRQTTRPTVSSKTEEHNHDVILTQMSENQKSGRLGYLQEIGKDNFCENFGKTNDVELNEIRDHGNNDRDLHLDIVHSLRTTTGGAMYGSSRLQEIFLSETNNNLKTEMIKEKLRTVKGISPSKKEEETDFSLNDDYVNPDDPYIYRLSQESVTPSNTEQCFKIQDTLRKIMEQPFSMGSKLSNAPVNTTNQRYVETSTVQLEPGVESGTSKPSPSDKFRFYWVPQNYREFLQTSDHPIASDYFPQDLGPPDYRRKYDGVDTNQREDKNGRARFCGVLIREFFHVNLYLRLHPNTGTDCYVLYNVVLWGRESQPVAHYKTPVPVPLLPGSAHHIASLSDSAVHDVLNQNYMVIVFYLTYFPRWNKPSDPKPENWFLSNPPGTKEMGISGGNAREFEKLLHNNCVTDIDVIVCDNVELPAHKTILCAQSPVIRSLIEMKYSKPQSQKIKLIGFDSVLSARQFIYFLYSGNLGPEEMDWYDSFKESDNQIKKRKVQLLNPVPRWVQILEQLAAGIRFQVPGLVRKGSAWLASELTIENAALVYTVAYKFQIEYLKKAACKFIKNDLAKVKATRGWDELKVYGEAVCELVTEKKETKSKVTQPPARIGNGIYLTSLHDLTAFSHIPLLHQLRNNPCCTNQPPLASKCGLGMWRDYGKWAASVPQNPEEMEFLLETTGEVGIPKLGTREFQQGLVKFCQSCKVNGCFSFETDADDKYPLCQECKNNSNNKVEN